MKTDAFTRSYIEAALWSTTDCRCTCGNLGERGGDVTFCSTGCGAQTGGEPLDHNYGPKDIAPATVAAMVADCADFQAAQAGLLAQAGDDDVGDDGRIYA